MAGSTTTGGVRRGRPAMKPGTWGRVRVRRLDGGGYEARVSFRRVDGTRGKLRRYAARPTPAESAAVEAVREEVQRTAGALAPAAQATIKVTDDAAVYDLAAAYVEWHAEDLAVSTRKNYRGAVKNHVKPALSDISVRECSTPVLEGLRLSLKPAAWKQVRAVLGAAWGWGLRTGLITAANPVPGTKTAALSRPNITVVNAAEVRALLDRRRAWSAAGRRPKGAFIEPLVLLQLASGTRVSEATRARWEDITGLDDDGPVMYGIRGVKQKHKRYADGVDPDPDNLPVSRSVQLAPFAADALRAWREHLGETAAVVPWVFPTSTGRHVQRAEVSTKLNEIQRYQEYNETTGAALLDPVARVHVSTHTLRHTAATWVAHDHPGGEYAAALFIGESAKSVVAKHYIAAEPAEVADLMQARWERDGD